MENGKCEPEAYASSSQMMENGTIPFTSERVRVRLPLERSKVRLMDRLLC